MHVQYVDQSYGCVIKLEAHASGSNVRPDGVWNARVSAEETEAAGMPKGSYEGASSGGIGIGVNPVPMLNKLPMARESE
jgi:hypothetical protein